MNAREDAQWVGDTMTQFQAANEQLRAALAAASDIIKRDSQHNTHENGFCIGRCLLPKLRPIIEQAMTPTDPADGQITSRGG